MGWEVRHGTEYYYRKSWHQGRCISEYIGNGSSAQAIATIEAIDRQKEMLRRFEWQAVKNEQLAIDQALDQARAAIRGVVNPVLRLTGHYQHKGQWRKRQMTEADIQKQAERLMQLREICDTPSPPAKERAELEAIYQKLPQMANVALDLLEFATDKTLKAVVDKGTFVIEQRARLDRFKAQLGYQAATPLERLLIDQVGLCWLRLQIAEMSYAGADSRRATLRLAELDYWERRLNASQRRFLRAMETLARIRKLASRTPEILQINIAQQQVNQAG